MRAKIIFEFKTKNTKKIFKLLLPPESFSDTTTIKGQAVDTITGVYVTNFGLSNLRNFSISGVFSKSGFFLDGKIITGYKNFNNLYENLYNFYKEIKNLNDTNEDYEVKFYNFYHNIFYKVKIDQFVFQENINRRGLYQFTLNFTGYENIVKKPKIKFTLDEILNKPTEIINKYKNKINNSLAQIINTIEIPETALLIGKDTVNDIINLKNLIQTNILNTKLLSSTTYKIIKDKINSIKDKISYDFNNTNKLYDLNFSLFELNTSLNQLNTTIKKLTFLQGDIGNENKPVEKIKQIDSSNYDLQIIMDTDTEIIVTGVYLNSDINKQGTNFFDYQVGNIIFLTHNPKTIVNIYYQEIVPNLVNKSLVNYYYGKIYSTIEKTAQYYGVNVNDLIQINNLDYPYISTENLSTKASGNLTIISNNTGYVIPKNTVFYASINGHKIRFFSVQDETITNLKQDIQIIAEDYGEKWNVPEYTIKYFDTENLVYVDEVYNTEKFSNGKKINTLTPDSKIKIPTENTIQGDIYLTDIKIENKDIEINNNGDIQTISGKNNLIQQITNKIMTPLNFYIYVNEYGSNLEEYIGKNSTLDNLNLIKISIINTLLQDPRIFEIKSLDIKVENDIIYIKTNIVLVNNLKQEIEIPVGV